MQKKAVLDHMARIECDLDIGEGQESCCLISYHCEYQDYLDDHGLLDVSTQTHNFTNSS